MNVDGIMHSVAPASVVFGRKTSKTTECQILKLSEMHQIRFPLGLCPRIPWDFAPDPAGGAYIAPQVLYLRGLILRGGRGRRGPTWFQWEGMEKK